jgi:bacterioferritin
MKGNDRLLGTLNQLLIDELTSINQYMVHAELCANWGYGRLHAAIQKQARAEMHHAEWLIERIIFLEGMPKVSQLNTIKLGTTVPDIVGIDQNAERQAIEAYNAGIQLAHTVDDQSSADLLTRILKMEEEHIDWAEQQRAQIEQMGLANYLSDQTEGADA